MSPEAVAPLVIEPIFDLIFAIETIIWLTVIIFSMLLAVAIVTMGLSIKAYHDDRKRVQTEGKITQEMLTRLGREEPDWAGWVDSLSFFEQEICIEILEEYLSLLEGQERTDLLQLAETLDIGSQARQHIEVGTHIERALALKQLLILGEPVDPEWLVAHIGDTRVERESAAAVLALESSPYNRRVAVDLLLGGEYLSGYGVDVLFNVLRHEPAEAFEIVEAVDIDTEDLFAQVLLVLGELGMADDPVPLGTILDSLDHDDPTIRYRACSILSEFGWRDDVTNRVDRVSLTTDPDPRVRSATYRMLGAWGDQESILLLTDALSYESDGRARVVLWQVLHALGRLEGCLDIIETDQNPMYWGEIDTVGELRSGPLL